MTKLNCEVITLTPDFARNLLSKNKDNRKISKRRVAEYAEDITNNRWALNGEPIIISEVGELNDGQHRCLAVIQANKSIQTLLVNGVNREARLTTNIGYARGVAHFLEMEGARNTTAIARMASLLLRYEKSEKVYEGHDQRGRLGKAIITKQEILEYANNNLEELSTAIEKVGYNTKAIGSIATISTAYVLINRFTEQKESVDNFFKKLITGIDLEQGNPILKTRERLISETLSDKSHSAKRTIEIIFRGWNNYRNNKTARIVVTGDWPKLIP